MNNSFHRVLLAAALTTVCACTAPKLQEPSSIAADVATRTGSSVNWGSGGENPPSADLLAANSPVSLPSTLDEAAAVAVALDASPTIAEQFSKLQAVRAEALEAATPLNPMVNFASGVPLDSMGVVPIFAMLMVQVDELWKQPLRSEGARDSYEAALLALGASAVAIAADARALWHEVSQRDEELSLAKDDYELAARSLTMARDALAAGEESAQGVADAEAQLVEAHHRVERVTQAGVSARLELMRLLGRAEAGIDWKCGRPDERALTAVHGVVPGETAMISAIAQSRLDVRAAQARVRSAAAMLLLAKGSRLGRLEIGAGWERTMENDAGIGVAANFEVPIFNDGSQRIAKAQAEYEGARIAAEKVRQDAVTEVRKALAAVVASQNTHAMSSATSLQNSMLQSERAQLAFTAGEQPERALVEARRALSQAKLEVNELERERRSARLALSKAVGFLPVEEAQ